MLLAAIQRLSEGQNCTFHIPDAALVDGKEALVFAWLGLLRWLGLAQCPSERDGGKPPNLRWGHLGCQREMRFEVPSQPCLKRAA